MDYAKILNEKQLEAVTSTSKYLRIIAGAGSGKTRVLTFRISYLIEKFNVYPNQILAITFTNKAAEEYIADEYKEFLTLPEDIKQEDTEMIENISAEAAEKQSEIWTEFKTRCGQ